MATNRRDIPNEIITETITVGKWDLTKKDGKWYDKKGNEMVGLDIKQYLGRVKNGKS